MRKADFVASILIIAIGIVMFSLQLGNAVGDTVVVYSDGQVFGKYDLFSDFTVDVISKHGTNTVCVSNGQAFVSASTCEDKNEVLQGKINRSGQSLICLPNKLVVTIVGGGENIDSISY